MFFTKENPLLDFFPADALASQVGLDNGEEVPAWYETEELQPMIICKSSWIRYTEK